MDLGGLGVVASGGVATVGPVLSGIGNLTPVAQVVAVLGDLFLVAGLAVIARRMLREWA